jgi:hypothetical protein
MLSLSQSVASQDASVVSMQWVDKKKLIQQRMLFHLTMSSI